MPPFIERAPSTPCERSQAAASRLRIPWWQKRTTSPLLQIQLGCREFVPMGSASHPRSWWFDVPTVRAHPRTGICRRDRAVASLRAVLFQYFGRSGSIISSVPEIRWRGIRMLLHSQRFRAARPDLIHVFAAIRHLKHPAFQPVFKIRQLAALLVILGEESMIPAVVTLHRRRMRAPGIVHHRRHEKSRHQGSIRDRTRSLPARQFPRR